MVIVQNIVTDTPALRRNPVFLYYSDRFTQPVPFRADIVVSIDDVYQKKLDMLDAQISQFYEWLPWTEGKLEEVPKDNTARKKWLAAYRVVVNNGNVTPEGRSTLEKFYAAEAPRVPHAEAFEITEDGRPATEEEMRKLLAFSPPHEPT